MKNDNPINPKIDDLLFLLIENALDAEGVARVEKWLLSEPGAKQYYFDFIKDYVGMKREAASVIEMNGESVSIHDEYDAELWSALSEVERVAERVPIEKDEPRKPPLIAKVERPRDVYSISRMSLMTIAFSAAAMLLLILFLRLSPAPNMQVATLTDSIGAVFAGNPDIGKGSRLSNRMDPLWLQKGVVRIEFDYGAEVVVEAPAEFMLNSADIITLRSGRLHALVPGRSKGFTVATPMASIIDLGTEFAVKVDFDGTSEVHMFKGKASLIPGAKGEASGSSQILTGNQARRVDPMGTVNEIAVRTVDFVRHIDSKAGLIWRGQSSIDLADIIGGGNGFGTGKLDYGINLDTGKLAYRDRSSINNSFFQGFTPVADSPYIDGIFCPFKDNATIQVSTQEHFFGECPLTSGTHWGYVMNSGWFGQSARGGDTYQGDLKLGGQSYGSKEHPAIVMHSNLGVTFDLEAIRQSVGELSIDRFTALCGISELVSQTRSLPEAPRASFFVLLDGQEKFEKQDISPADGAVSIDVEIPREARFLTLLVTDGSDKTYDGDWTLFARPALSLTKQE